MAAPPLPRVFQARSGRQRSCARRNRGFEDGVVEGEERVSEGSLEPIQPVSRRQQDPETHSGAGSNQFTASRFPSVASEGNRCDEAHRVGRERVFEANARAQNHSGGKSAPNEGSPGIRRVPVPRPQQQKNGTEYECAGGQVMEGRSQLGDADGAEDAQRRTRQGQTGSGGSSEVREDDLGNEIDQPKIHPWMAPSTNAATRGGT